MRLLYIVVLLNSVRILSIDKDVIRTGDKAKVRFRFMSRPEFLVIGNRLIFREGRAKGIGKISQLFPTTETENHATNPINKQGASSKQGAGKTREHRNQKQRTVEEQ